MNKLYVIGAGLAGFAALFFYHAGRQDMANELKAAEAKRWEEAARADDNVNVTLDPIPD